MAYVGSIKQRIEITATLTNEYHYTKPSYTGYGRDDRTIYIFADEDGNVYKCDTNTVLGIDVQKDGGEYGFEAIFKNDVVKLRGTIKAHNEYKGIEQTVLNRVNILQLVSRPKTKKQLMEDKRREQMESLQAGDELMEMTYSNYKKHYADCETLAGSFEIAGCAYITVIVRSGRLVNSGTRGRHFDYYEVRGVNGKLEIYKAISEETAERRFLKEHPNTEIESIDLCR